MERERERGTGEGTARETGREGGQRAIESECGTHLHRSQTAELSEGAVDERAAVDAERLPLEEVVLIGCGSTAHRREAAPMWERGREKERERERQRQRQRQRERETERQRKREYR